MSFDPLQSQGPPREELVQNVFPVIFIIEKVTVLSHGVHTYNFTEYEYGTIFCMHKSL